MTENNQYLSTFDALKAEAAQLAAPAMDIAVKDFATSQAAIDAGMQVKMLSKKIEERRKAVVEPFNKMVKQINEYAKDLSRPLVEAEAYIKAQLAAFDREQEKIREAARIEAEKERQKKEAEVRAKQEAERMALAKKLEAEHEAANLFGAEPDAKEKQEAEIAALEQKATIELAGLKTEAWEKERAIADMGIKNARKTWKCELVDINLVPKEFLTITLNEKAVLAMARNGVTTIPGVELFQTVSIALGQHTYVPAAALRGGR